MRVTNTRVTNTAMNRNFGRSVNDVHSKLNKAMNKISSGRAYEAAAENPLAYYEGNKLDNKYLELQSQLGVLGDLKHRLEEQEKGAYSIQTKLAEAQNKMIYIRSSSNNEGEQTVETVRQDFLQKGQFMVNCLNGQYEDYYVFGGNDASNIPFSLSSDAKELTFNHKFPGDDGVTTMTIKLTGNIGDPEKDLTFESTYTDANGNTSAPKTGDAAVADIMKAMKEQGRVDVGYGNIAKRDTLIDTFTGGLNVLTGITSDALKEKDSSDPAGALKEVKEKLYNSPLFLVARAADACEGLNDGSLSTGDFDEKMGVLIDQTTTTHSWVGTIYSDLGNKWATMENLETKHKKTSQNLQEEYKDKLGADPYEAITEMFSYQYSYSAALQIGSRLMQSSLFDFIR